MQELLHYLSKLVSKHPAIEEVWLIGSRANGRARADSDWDLLVFTNGDALNGIMEDPDAFRADIDLLVVYNEQGDFRSAWGREKSGNLGQWSWQRLSEDTASYRQVKWKDDEEAASEGLVDHGELEVTTAVGTRVWPAG